MSDLICGRCSVSVLEKGLKTAQGDTTKMLFCPDCLPVIEKSITDKAPLVFSTPKSSSTGRDSLYARRFRKQRDEAIAEADYSVFVSSSILCDLRKTDVTIRFLLIDADSRKLHSTEYTKQSPQRSISQHDSDAMAVVDALNYLENMGLQEDLVTLFIDSTWLAATVFNDEYKVNSKSRFYEFYNDCFVAKNKFPELEVVWIPGVVNPVSRIFAPLESEQ